MITQNSRLKYYIPFITVLLFLLCEHFIIQYNDYDNYILSLITNCKYSDNNFTIYLSPILSLLIKSLHIMCNSMDAFLFICEVGVCLSLFGLSMVTRFYCRDNNLLHFLVSIIYVGLFLALDANHANYTIVTSIIFVSASIIFIMSLLNSYNKFGMISGTILLIFASLFRIESVFMSLAFFGLALIFILIRPGQNPKALFSKLLPYAISYILFLGIILSCRMIYLHVFIPEEYAFNQVRTELNDYKDDYYFFHIFLMDTDGFTTERMQEILDNYDEEHAYYYIKETAETSEKTVSGNSISNLLSFFFKYFVIFASCGVSFLILLFSQKNLLKEFAALIITLSLLAIYAISIFLNDPDNFIVSQFRYNIRSGCLLIITLLLSLLFFFFSKDKLVKYSTFIAFICFVIIMLFFKFEYNRLIERVKIVCELSLMIILITNLLYQKKLWGFYLKYIALITFFSLVVILTNDTKYTKSQNVFTANINNDFEEYNNHEGIYVWEEGRYCCIVIDDHAKAGKLFSDTFLTQNIESGMWTYGQKYYKDYMKSINLENPMKALFGTDEVYFVAKTYHAQIIKKYYPNGSDYDIKVLGYIKGIPINKYVLKNQ